MKPEIKTTFWRTFTVTLIVWALTPVNSFSQEASTAQRVGRVRLLPEIQEAISKGLSFLAKTQNQDGKWGDKHPVADTSLALMSYMLQGHVPGRGTYGRNMDRAVAYLVEVGKKGHAGYMGTPNHHGGMYEHGLAILALSEAWGQSTNPHLRNTKKKPSRLRSDLRTTKVDGATILNLETRTYP